MAGIDWASPRTHPWGSTRSFPPRTILEPCPDRPPASIGTRPGSGYSQGRPCTKRPVSGRAPVRLLVSGTCPCCHSVWWGAPPPASLALFLHSACHEISAGCSGWCLPSSPQIPLQKSAIPSACCSVAVCLDLPGSLDRTARNSFPPSSTPLS